MIDCFHNQFISATAQLGNVYHYKKFGFQLEIQESNA